MKKNVLLIILLFLLTTTFIFTQEVVYDMGSAQSKKGAVKIDYIKKNTGKGDYIKLSLKKDKLYANIFLPYDLKEVRRLIDKFAEWHQTAIDTKWDLNKNIGALSTVRIDFVTVDSQYEIVFLEKRTGLKITSFDLGQIQAFKEMITDEKIDYLINEERRRKEKENELFK